MKSLLQMLAESLLPELQLLIKSTMRPVSWCSVLSLSLALMMIAPNSSAIGSKECQLSSAKLPVEVQDSKMITHLKLNGQDTEFMVDTGAFWSLISGAQAQALHLNSNGLRGFLMSGVGGFTPLGTANVKSVDIAGVNVKNIEFEVGGSDYGRGLLGDNILMIGDLDVDASQGLLSWVMVKGCANRSFAYWAKDGNYQIADILKPLNSRDEHVYLNVIINGVTVKAILDSGAHESVISLSAAKRIGFDIKNAGVRNEGSQVGVGTKAVKSWIMPVERMVIGTESIEHTAVAVIEQYHLFPDDAEMLLGFDFFLSHHLFIANHQHKLYFTYNGGRLFARAPPPKSTLERLESSEEPALANASEYAKRGEGHMGRGEYAAAIKDLDKAIELEPENAGFLMARIRTKISAKLTQDVDQDFELLLTLDPDNFNALLFKAEKLYREKSPIEGLATLHTALLKQPLGSENALQVADVLRKQYELKEAVDIYNEWIKIHSYDVKLGQVETHRAWCRGLLNDHVRESLKDVNRLIRSNPEGKLGELYVARGVLNLRLGKSSDALADFNHVLNTQPQSGWALYGRAMANRNLGNEEAANTDLETVKQAHAAIIDRAKQFDL